MTDEKVIDAEFDKDDCGPFDSPISAYKAGFRTAERLAKIEVIELAKQMFNDLDEMNPIDYTDSFDVINTLLEELKPTK